MRKELRPVFPYLDHAQLHTSRKLFCLSHAGGSASKYYSWLSEMISMAVIPVELPGKQSRMDQHLSGDLKQLIEELAEEIASVVSPEDIVYIYGHSFGAMLAFGITHQLECEYSISVQTLIVAGRHSVNLEKNPYYHSSMGDDALVDELIRQGGTPKEVLETKELLELFLPIIKNDYMLDEQYKYRGEKINANIIAHAGNNDADTSKKDMESWKDVTNSQFTFELFEGDHFFPFVLAPNYCHLLEQSLLYAEKRNQSEY